MKNEGFVVFATVNGDKLTPINVGSGRQTFKWLAAVIQSRLIEDSVLRLAYNSENCIISAIKNVKDELINPMDLILEHSDEDKKVNIIAEVNL